MSTTRSDETRATVPDPEIRVLSSVEELSLLPEFERSIWGASDENVSFVVLVSCIDEGGVALGAFDGEELVGSVFGFRTRDAEVMHSHYLAVAAAHRGRGLGERLKFAQAEWCLAEGITAMRWTFDPLQLVNAHLNLVKLGAVGERYRVDHYGPMGGINGGMASDRLTVRWELDATVRTRVAQRWTERCAVVVPVVSPEEIAAGSATARSARMSLRDSMEPLLADGWRVVSVDLRDRRYELAR